MPDDVAKALANFGKPKADPKKWAREILSMAEAGTYTLPIGILYAKQALGLAPDDNVDIEQKSEPMEVTISTFMEVGGKVQKVELR